ncbi:MAG: korA 4, partial [Sporomusa sp.]|nr:korA 4 [Sporomusa sp.]
HLQPELLELHNIHLQKKYAEITANEVRYEELHTEDAELVLVAYGITSRIARTAMEKARSEGMKVGMLRPITLWPFPEKPLATLASKAAGFLTIELSAGQMIEDVRLAVNGAKPVYFYGRAGGMIPSPKAVYEQIANIFNGKEGR